MSRFPFRSPSPAAATPRSTRSPVSPAQLAVTVVPVITGIALAFLAPRLAFAHEVARSGRTLHVDASTTIQSAIDQATSGDVVLVAPGIYDENIDFLGKAIQVIGTLGASETILRGGGPVVTFHNGEGSGSVLQGFTVRDGSSASHGSGISAMTVAGVSAAPTIRDCVIRNNVSSVRGGGIAGNPTLERCVVRDNQANDDGGGIYGEPILRHCVVAMNTAQTFLWGGGGLYAAGPGALVEDCLFEANVSRGGFSVGAGIFGPATIRRTVFWANRSSLGSCPDDGGGAAATNFSGTRARIENCAILNSTTAGLAEAGVLGDFDVVNSIFLGNRGRGFGPSNLGFGAVVTYSNVEGAFSSGLGNFNDDPLFVDPSDGDFHLRATSPCIDAGDPALLDPDGTRSDVGPYFFQRLYLRTNATPARWSAPAWSQLSLRIGGKHALEMLAGIDLAHHDYVLLGTFSGTSPGFTVQGLNVPIQWDPYTRFVFSNPNTPPLSGFRGTFDSVGRASASIDLPPGQMASLAGRVLHHAWGAFDPGSGRLESVSNPLALTLVP